jgi:hypothetical protein
MASNSIKDSKAAHNHFWVGMETIEAVSLFSTNGAARMPCCLIERKEDWEITLPTNSDRICLRFSANRIPMYEDVFQEVSFRLPFSPFQVSVFEWMELCPSQLSPDSFAYMIAFELVCRFLHLPATKELFFAIFTIQKWVSFRQRKSLLRSLIVRP